MKDKAVLITGATGFIGRYLVNNISNCNFKIYALSRREKYDFKTANPIEIIKGDITATFELPHDVGTIYHCAGIITREDMMQQVNISGTQRIVDTALRYKCHLIYLSSAGVVGRTSSVYIDERTKCNPQSFYEKTKLEAEVIIKKAISTGLKAQILRPTIVFGNGREPVSDSFLELVKSMKSGRYKHIGKGTGIYNIVHASEVARAMIALDDDTLSNGGTYFVNTPITFKDMFEIVQEETTGRVVKPIGIPYLLALGTTAAFSIVSELTGKNMPLTFSRLRTLTNKRVFAQQHLLDMTTYRQLFSVGEYIKLTCRQYAEAGLLN